MTDADRIARRARELADRCGCRNVKVHWPVARLQVELEAAE